MNNIPENQPENNSSTLLEATNISCIREDRILFEHLNFAIKAGEIIQVEGPNGAGKTSLLRILAGLSMPFEGEVNFNNESIKKSPEFFHQHLLYLGHLAGVKGEMTAQENLSFKLALTGDNTDNAEQALAEVNLLGFEDALASNLSAGQHRRIALAQLWQSTAPIWILDEPFTAIDKQGVKKLEQRFKKHLTAGGCIILTTHQDLSLLRDEIKKVTLTYRYF